MLFHPFDRETFLIFELEQMHEHEFHQLHPHNPNYDQYKLHLSYIFICVCIYIYIRKMKAFGIYLEIGVKPTAISYLQGCIFVRLSNHVFV